MRWFWVPCLLLASLLPLSAEDWTTADGKTYKNVTVVGPEDDGVRITYDGGVGKIPYYELPVDIQKRFGQDIESLAEKKRAVDRAIEDAVRNAAAAEQMKQPVIPGTVPENAPGGTGQPGSVPGGTYSTVPGGSTPTPNGGTSPGVQGGGAPGSPAATGGGPGNSTAAGGGPGNSTAAGGGPGGTAPNASGPHAAPGASTNVAPGGTGPNTATNPGQHPGGPAATAHPGAPGSATAGTTAPEETQPVSQTPAPAGVMAAGGKPLQLAVANYSYNTSLDVCYLDSPPIDVLPQLPPKGPLPPGQGSSLTFRIITDGRTPQAPDRFEVTFLSVGGDGGDLSTRAIIFRPPSSSGSISVDESARKDSGSLPGGGQNVQYASFYLEPGQVREICCGKPMTFSVGPNVYQIDQRGATALHSYLADVDSLEAAPSSLMRSFYKMLARIPSFFSLISTVCEYVILGSFGLLVAASIAAFILGISRFIKM